MAGVQRGHEARDQPRCLIVRQQAQRQRVLVDQPVFQPGEILQRGPRCRRSPRLERHVRIEQIVGNPVQRRQSVPGCLVEKAGQFGDRLRRPAGDLQRPAVEVGRPHGLGLFGNLRCNHRLVVRRSSGHAWQHGQQNCQKKTSQPDPRFESRPTLTIQGAGRNRVSAASAGQDSGSRSSSGSGSPTSSAISSASDTTRDRARSI